MTKSLHTLTFSLSAGADADPLRVEGIAYSGGVVPAYGWHGDIAIDLSGLQNDGAELPLLADHQQSIESIAGRASSVQGRSPRARAGLPKVVDSYTKVVDSYRDLF